MNAKFKKFLKRTAIVTTGTLAFAGALVGGYLLAPNRTQYIDISVKQKPLTPFEQFVEQISRDVGLTQDEGTTAINYLSASLDNFAVNYTVEGSEKVNSLTVAGGVDFRLSALSLSGIEFNIDVVANYNGKEVPLTLGHFHDDVYFGLKDMKIKFTNYSEDELIEQYWYSFALYSGLDFPKLLSKVGDIIGDKLGGLIDGLINGSKEEPEADPEPAEQSGGIDFASLLAEGPKTEFANKQYTFTLGEEGGDLCIKLITDEKFKLKRVDLGTITAGNVSISGAIDVELKPYDEFVSPAAGNDYVEVFNYNGLTQKLISLFKEDENHQRLGLEFALDLDNVKTPSSPIDIAKVAGSINVDFDKLLDLSQYKITASEDDFNRSHKAVSDSEIYGKIKDAGFNLQLNLIGQNDVEYANLDLVFAGGQGYLRFNEQEDQYGEKVSVMKLNVDTETMNWIVDKVPELISNLSDEQSNTLDTLSSFLSEDLVDSIKDGDYSFILDMIDQLSNDENGFRLGVDLSSLGIGSNAYLDLRVNNDSSIKSTEEILEEFGQTAEYLAQKSIVDDPNASAEEKAAAEEMIAQLLNEFIANSQNSNTSALQIGVEGLQFGNFALNAGLRSTQYSASTVESDTKDNYQSVKFIRDVVDQISEFVNTKQTGFEISGDMKNSEGLGIDFSGSGQLDNNDTVKEGFGSMIINQYKYHANSLWAQHKLAVNVTNLESNVIKTVDEDGNVLTRNNQNEALFVYGDPNGDNVKGKMHLQTFTDIFDIITTFIDDYGEDVKYTKFLAPITELLGMSTIGEIIDSKDYMHLASNELLKEVSVINNGGGLKIVVSKVLLGLPEDINIEIEFNGNNETGNQTLKALKIKELVLSDKEDADKLNLTFQLTDYDPNMEDIVHKNDTYMNLDGVKTLLDLGINTTKVNFYHLSAGAHVAAPLGIDIDLTGINFFIYVDGERVKIYGKIDDVPTIPLMTTDVYDEVFTGSKLMSTEFSFETYTDNSQNKVGGMFNIHRTLKDKTSRIVTTSSFPFFKRINYYDCKAYHYRCDSGNFMDDIANYLLRGVLGLNDTTLGLIMGDGTSSSSSSEKAAGNFTNLFTDTGFSCVTTGTKTNTVHTIQLGLNLNELVGIDALRELEATITSKRLTYEGNTDGIDILSTLDASLRIHFAVDIDVSFNASIKEAQILAADALSSWNAKGAAGLAFMSGNINGVTIGENSSYYNTSTNPYKYSYEEIIG